MNYFTYFYFILLTLIDLLIIDYPLPSDTKAGTSISSLPGDWYPASGDTCSNSNSNSELPEIKTYNKHASALNFQKHNDYYTSVLFLNSGVSSLFSVHFCHLIWKLTKDSQYNRPCAKKVSFSFDSTSQNLMVDVYQSRNTIGF